MYSASTLRTPEKITLMRSLIPYLLERGATPVQDLAEHFDTDADTVRRIIRFFGLAGVPGETATYQHQDLFDIDWDALEERDEAILVRTVVVHENPRFSSREVTACLAGLQFIRSIPGLADDAEITALMKKLASSTDVPSVALEVSAPEQRPELAQLRQAVLEQALVEFQYISRAGESSARLVLPIHLESFDDIWYVRAWCTDRQEERLFRLDRMSDISVTEDSVAGNAAGIANSVTRGAASSWPPQSSELLISVQVSDERSAVLRRFEPTRDDSNWIIALADRTRAWDVVAAAPGHVVIKAPAAFRDAVSAWASDALDNYKT